MRIVVNDACILIDLLKVNLSDGFFHLPFDMHTTDFVCAEIKGEETERFKIYIDKELIAIHRCSEEEFEEVLKIKSDNPPLSLADCSCFWLCKRLSAML